MSRQASIKKTDLPEGWSMEAADFINKVSIREISFYIMNLVASKKTDKSFRIERLDGGKGTPLV